MPTDGKFVEIVGNYNPTDLNQPLVVQKDRVEYWISKGAQPTNTVAKLLNKQGFNLAVTQYHKAPKKVAKPTETAAAAPVVEKAPEEATTPKIEEQPAETAPVEAVAEEVPVEEKKEEVMNSEQVSAVAEAMADKQDDENKEETSIAEPEKTE